MLKKIIYKLLKILPFHIPWYSLKFKRLLIVCPKKEPHDFRQLLWPDFNKTKNFNLGKICHVGASAGVNSLTLFNNNISSSLCVFEVNPLNEISLEFNLKGLSSKIYILGISEKGGCIQFKNVSSIGGSLSMSESSDSNSVLYDTISVSKFAKLFIGVHDTLVLNCNGMEYTIISEFFIQAIFPKILIVYFFSDIGHYSFENLFDLIQTRYQLQHIDGQYYFFSIKNNL